MDDLSSGGAEIDLLLTLPGRAPWAIEVKRSLDPRPRKGFHSPCKDVRPEAKLVVYPCEGRFRLAEDIEAVTVLDLAKEVAGSARRPSDDHTWCPASVLRYAYP